MIGSTVTLPDSPKLTLQDLSNRQKDHLIGGRSIGGIGENVPPQTQYSNFFKGEDVQFNATYRILFLLRIFFTICCHSPFFAHFACDYIKKI